DVVVEGRRDRHEPAQEGHGEFARIGARVGAGRTGSHQGRQGGGRGDDRDSGLRDRQSVHARTSHPIGVKSEISQRRPTLSRVTRTSEAVLVGGSGSCRNVRLTQTITTAWSMVACTSAAAGTVTTE